MYLCQHSQRHSRVQHCKDQGEDISDQPLQSLSPPPLRLGGHRVSAWLHLLLNTTTALQLFTLFFEHSHFFALLCTSLQRMVATSLHMLLNLSRCLPAVHLTSLNTEYVWCRIPLNLYLFPKFHGQALYSGFRWAGTYIGKDASF